MNQDKTCMRDDAFCGCSGGFSRHAMALVSRRFMLSGLAAFFTTIGMAGQARGQLSVPAKPAKPFLFRNFQLFDGTAINLKSGLHLIVKDNKIAALAGGSPPPGNFHIVDCGNRILMPGLIDAHVHTIMESVTIAEALNSNIGYLYAVAVRAAGLQLLRGFTSVRDCGGPSFGLKMAIDAGVCAGPRIYPSGAFLSQTGGHGDFGSYNDVPRTMGGALDYPQRAGMTALADGVDQVLLRAREQLRQGATQIKMMAGGGVASDYDPLDAIQYTQDEFRAGVSAAANWGTYVTVHAYTPAAIRTAINAGACCIEHGQLADDPVAALMASKGIWWSLQPFLNDQDAIPFPKGSANDIKQLKMVAGTDMAYKLAKNHGVKTAFGTDILFDPRLAARQGAQLAKLARWYTPAQILKMATADNGALLALSGPRNPYPGRLGVIEPGAYADMILVNGNPLQDINLTADPDRNFSMIMKDGRVYKWKL